MRLQEYINDVEKVKDLKIGLVKHSSEYSDLISNIRKKYEIKKDIIKEIEIFNMEFRKIYNGKFKFDFCLVEDININDLKIKNDKTKDKIKLKWFELNHELSRVKTELEDKLKLSD